MDGKGKLDGIVDIIRKKLEELTKTGGMQARKQFKVFDRDGSGIITKQEFAEALSKWGIELSDSEMTVLFAKFDHDNSGEINYEEFVRHVMEQGMTSVQIGRRLSKVQLAHNNLKASTNTRSKTLQKAFERLDIDKSGYLDRAELRTAVEAGGIHLTGEELDILLGLYDESGDNKVS
jgi:Ca2+-binding EF-hand superfamily protein